MPLPPGTKIKWRPCTRKKDRLVATNASNFTSEHLESNQHDEAMTEWKTVFPTLTDKKQLFIVLSPQEHATEVEIAKDHANKRQKQGWAMCWDKLLSHGLGRFTDGLGWAQTHFLKKISPWLGPRGIRSHWNVQVLYIVCTIHSQTLLISRLRVKITCDLYENSVTSCFSQYLNIKRIIWENHRLKMGWMARKNYKWAGLGRQKCSWK